MKITFLTSLLALAITLPSMAEEGWIKMFNGKDLSGWKSNVSTEDKPEEKKNAFTVEDGLLKIAGGRAHLFFVGEDGKANFKNFKFKAKVKTTEGANSGIYFHTKFQDSNWPAAGYECQVNATHTDRKKTGGLYAVKDVIDNAPNKDGEWFDYEIKVQGKHIVIKIDGKTTVDWNEPENWDPTKELKNMDGRKLSEGTIAIQGHDPQSVVYYKDLEIKPLP